MNTEARLAALEQHRQSVTWWLSGASLLVSVVALWFSVFKPAPTVILQQPPAAAAKAPQLASPLQETKKPRR
jgi:flagellar biosynthesis/type III secretory pathway M-ring protein FliF/YscJ